MNIADAFQKALNTPLKKHIETVVSNVLLFESKAYKIYKSNSDFFNKNFNDLSDKGNRFQFTRNDFDWNNRLTPEVYTKLVGIVFESDTVRFTEPNDAADELVIEMNVVDMSNQLINLLVGGKIAPNDCFKIGQQLGERLKELPVLTHEHTVFEDFTSRLLDVGPWVGSRKEISKEKLDKYLGFLKEYVTLHKEEFNTKDLMGMCVDIHSDNAVYTDGVFLPVDTYAPKEAWLHGYKFINIYRIATDIYGFLGKHAFEEVLKGYEDTSGEKIPRQHDKFLITYCELINWPYQYMLSEKEPWRLEVAKKYEAVLAEIFA